MGNFFQRAKASGPDLKRKILGTLQSLENYIVTEANEGELFALQVVKEVLNNTPASDITKAVEAVVAKKRKA